MYLSVYMECEYRANLTQEDMTDYYQENLGLIMIVGEEG